MSSVENTVEAEYASDSIASEYDEFSETEQALRDSERRLAVELTGMTRLHELSMYLARQNDLTKVMREVMDAASEFLNSNHCTAQLLNSHDRALHLVAWKGFDQNFADRFQIVMEAGFTTCAAALGRRKRVVVGDLTANADFKKFATLVVPLGILAAVSTPLLADDGRLL